MAAWKTLVSNAKRVGMLSCNDATMLIGHQQRLRFIYVLTTQTKRDIKSIQNHLFSLNDAIGLRLPMPLRAKGTGT